jgi:hypothetical protein
MLIVFAVFSALLLGLTVAVARSRDGLSVACVVSVVAGLLGACVGPRPLALNAALVFVAALACQVRQDGHSRFWKYALAATAVNYAIVGTVIHLRLQDNLRYRERYPFESLSGRLAYETRSRNSAAPVWAAPVGTEGSSRLEHMEDRAHADFAVMRQRQWILQEVHESYVEQFIAAPGFGVGRQLRRPDNSTIDLPPDEPIPLASFDPQASAAPPEGAAGAPGREVPDKASLWDAHEMNLLDFLNVPGFGYVRNRDHVAGFQAHHFRKPAQGPTERWQLERLDLVSLLKFDRPAVYLSDNLPRMDELRGARTRPLDPFEGEALASLRRGEDLVPRQDDEGLRVLGSVRAVKQCTECHDVQRGTLLGAFSYKFRRK